MEYFEHFIKRDITFKHYLRTCERCNEIFKSKFKSGRVCDECKFKKHNIRNTGDNTWKMKNILMQRFGEMKNLHGLRN